MYKKIFVILIISLFIGTNIIPAINANINENYKESISKENIYQREEFWLNIFIDDCYQVLYEYNKNVSKEEFKFKMGPFLEDMFYFLMNYYENNAKYSYEKKILVRMENTLLILKIF